MGVAAGERDAGFYTARVVDSVTGSAANMVILCPCEASAKERALVGCLAVTNALMAARAFGRLVAGAI
jgi:hypothetical protein